MLTNAELMKNAVLTAPLSLEGDDPNGPPNLLQRIFSLLSTLHTGSDLIRFQLPPQFNLPKSQLQCYGESVYCINTDLLSNCNHGGTPIDRFISVIAWSISTLRPLTFGVAPYNPILGETHHASRGNFNVLLEQVSHHPPVTALHATDEKENIEMIWCHSPIPKFLGTYIETEVSGERQLNLLDKNETYVMNSPKLMIRFLPVPSVDWLGNVIIQCKETGLIAELFYKGNSFFPRRSSQRSIKGKIFLSSSLQTIYTINGHWDRIVTTKDVSNGKVTTIYDANKALSGLKTPMIKDPKAIMSSESTMVWAEVSRAILQKNWEKAREEKSSVEEKQREVVKELKLRDENWVPKHFRVSHSKENGWKCLPNQNLVNPAPIVVAPH